MADKTRKLHNLYFLAADDWHKRIVASYGGETGERIDWSIPNVDQYLIRHTPTHLINIAHNDPAASRHLFALLTDFAYVTARVTLEEGNTRPLEEDYEAASIALAEDEEKVVLRAIRYRPAS